jgi:hypothetical protein
MGRIPVKGALETRADQRSAETAPVRKVVLLGASNLTQALERILRSAASLWGGPLQVLAACGHGRSYGRASRVLVRELPGILECRLWGDLARTGDLPTSALVTDIGNDILYEEPVEQIAGWVEACFDRLAAARARTVVTLLPIDHLPAMSKARFYFFRTLLVPRCRIGFAEVLRRSAELNEHVRRLALERDFPTIRPRSEWYGLDPIHIRLLKRRRAWHEILSGWAAPGQTLQPSGGGFWRSLYLRTRTPDHRRVFGIEQRGRHPSARLDDGTTVAIY